MPRTPKVIGLTGGIASGKTAVAAMFAQLGAAVIDADAIAREVLRSPEIAEKLRKNWGHETFRDGRPDRARIAEIAFSDPGEIEGAHRLGPPADVPRDARPARPRPRRPRRAAHRH